MGCHGAGSPHPTPFLGLTHCGFAYCVRTHAEHSSTRHRPSGHVPHRGADDDRDAYEHEPLMAPN